MSAKRIVAGFAMAGSLLLLSGCASYYLVKDPVGGKSYYTQEIEEVGGGAVKFTDQRTGSRVTIQNSEIKELNEQEYSTGKNSSK